MAKRRTIRRLDVFISRLNDSYYFAEHSKWTHEDLLESLSEEVFKHIDYKRLTQYERGILEGMRRMHEAEMRKKQYFAYETPDGIMDFDTWRKAHPEVPSEELGNIFRNDNGHFYWTGTEVRFY